MPNKNYVALQIAADPLFNISKNFNMCRDYGVTPRPKVSSKKMTKKINRIPFGQRNEAIQQTIAYNSFY